MHDAQGPSDGDGGHRADTRHLSRPVRFTLRALHPRPLIKIFSHCCRSIRFRFLYSTVVSITIHSTYAAASREKCAVIFDSCQLQTERFYRSWYTLHRISFVHRTCKSIPLHRNFTTVSDTWSHPCVYHFLRSSYSLRFSSVRETLASLFSRLWPSNLCHMIFSSRRRSDLSLLTETIPIAELVITS